MVVHIMGKRFKNDWVVSYGLSQQLFGVGPFQAKRLCAKIGLYPGMRMGELTQGDIMAIVKELTTGVTIESDLHKKINANIERRRKTGSYVGRRHVLGLPVKGQKTRTNAKTAQRLNRFPRRHFVSVSEALGNLAKEYKSAPGSETKGGVMGFLSKFL
ncbi:37S ribosomal protein subunit sws2 [Yarrowia sp. C11]|nr:37S ribosomal protein subunit sws2 [Yarrowia sp. E02]KAG5373067.1 37S ribosomal protein subunit sws2 [Yarrowia sp. C11]